MNISQLEGEGYRYLTLSEVADLVIGNARVDKATRVQILTGDTVLLDNDYYGDPNQEVHLDVREIVRNHTWLPVPGLFTVNGQPEMRFAPSPTMTIQREQVQVLEGNGWAEGEPLNKGLRQEWSGRIALKFTVTRYYNNVTDYTAIIFLCEKFVSSDWRTDETFNPEIDELQVPEDYLLPMSMFNLFKADNGTDRYGRVEVISSRGKETYDGKTNHGASEEEAVMFTQLIKVEDVPHEIGEPFYMAISSYTSESTGDSVSGTPHTILTPRFKVVRKEMEQYAFLSPEGVYYNIPMAGVLRHIPEYELVVLRKTAGYEKTSSFIADLHEQNSGALTRKTAVALSKYLCSDMVYHYDRDAGLWRRIVIENPSVAITGSGGAHSLTFQWRYEDNNKYFNY